MKIYENIDQNKVSFFFGKSVFKCIKTRILFTDSGYLLEYPHPYPQKMLYPYPHPYPQNNRIRKISMDIIRIHDEP